MFCKIKVTGFFPFGNTVSTNNALTVIQKNKISVVFFFIFYFLKHRTVTFEGIKKVTFIHCTITSCR